MYGIMTAERVIREIRIDEAAELCIAFKIDSSSAWFYIKQNKIELWIYIAKYNFPIVKSW